MVSFSQVEENMEIKFKKKHQGAGFLWPLLNLSCFMEARYEQLRKLWRRNGCCTKMLRMVFKRLSA